jgi:ribonuclease HII
MKTLKILGDFPQELIAVDEVGRGPLSGPVVIGAVRVLIEDLDSYKKLLKFLKLRKVGDSKALSSDERAAILTKLGLPVGSYREKIRVVLKDVAIDYVTWEMDHEVIDRENILAASLRGMKEAALHLSQRENFPSTLLIDGPHALRWGTETSPFKEIALVKGDSKSLLIGLASIIAKEKRDAFMKEMHELYPQYGFNTHSGYGTQFHRDAIKLHGPSPIHRKTFAGVKEYLRS